LKLLAGPTRVVRTGHTGALTAELLDVLTAGQDDWLRDVRDLMAVLAPYHDVARRLGAIRARCSSWRHPAGRLR